MWRRAAAAIVAVGLFVFAWLLRFNDPGGSFAGLTDDHFFYLIRGWQILFGDLPVRDFVDHGAPLYYYIAAAVQLVERGTFPEVAFSVTMLAAGAAATFLIAWRASGSLLLGLAGALFHVLLEPRFYNYPKILVYAAAIPLLWRFADRQDRWTRFALAGVTALGFFLRHDHGVYVGAATIVLLLFLTELPWRTRARHAVVYGALAFALVAPYLAFIQVNEGLGAYLRDASDWVDKDRSRTPVVWPGLFDNPDGVSEEAASGTGAARAVAAVRANSVAWTYYLEIVMPFVALVVLALSHDGFRPGWPRAVPKLGTVAILALVLDAGFLRSPLAARLADPSVPHAVLAAWLGTAFWRLMRSRDSLRAPLRAAAPALRVAGAVLILPIAAYLAIFMSTDFHERLDKSALVERPGKPFERAGEIRRQLRREWDLSTWAARDDRPDLITLSLYLEACTDPGDRVFVQPYIPQVLGLARRAFAGGHADLRPGFFDAVAAQTRTLDRLRGQAVPVALLETGDSYENFREAFPLIARHFDHEYHLAGTHTFDGRFALQLFARNDRMPSGEFAPLRWPCFR